MAAPAAPCRKQKPSMTKFWPERYAKIEGKSLNFYESESGTKARGSSIKDVTGCTVGREREKFRFDAAPGHYYAVTLQRKGHTNGPG